MYFQPSLDNFQSLLHLCHCHFSLQLQSIALPLFNYIPRILGAPSYSQYAHNSPGIKMRNRLQQVLIHESDKPRHTWTELSLRPL